jgi:hypothetical protein
MIGVDKVTAIDHSDYEGAQLLIDLNQPLDSKHEGIGEFIFGGSVGDNVFDVGTYLRNISRLLAPGGRFICHETGRNTHDPYLVFTPSWFFDYFGVNGFSDCKLYVFEIQKYCSVYAYDIAVDRIQNHNFTRSYLKKVFWPNLFVGASFQVPIRLRRTCGLKLGSASIFNQNPFFEMASSHPEVLINIVLIAKKGPNSTWDKSPIQDKYRNEEQWASYLEDLARMKRSTRPWY